MAQRTTDTTATLSVDEFEGDTSGECMACSHPLSTHDVIAVRFCNATVDHALARGCICH